MNFTKTSMTLAAVLTSTGAVSAQTTFTFESSPDAETAFDGQGSGASITLEDITLFTTATAPTFDAAGAVTGTTDALTTIDAGNGIGIDNPSIDNENFEALFGDNDEAGFLSSQESLSISFDQPVVINAFNFFGVGNNETVTVLVSSVADPFTFGSSGGSDNNDDPFGAGFELAAGETVSFTDVADSGGALARYSLETFTVTAVPEPTSLVLLGLGGLAIAGRRRRA